MSSKKSLTSLGTSKLRASRPGPDIGLTLTNMGHLKKWAPAEVAQFTTGGWWVPPVRCIPSIGTTAGGPCVRCGGVGVPCQAGYSKIFEPSREAVACGCCEARKC